VHVKKNDLTVAANELGENISRSCQLCGDWGCLKMIEGGVVFCADVIPTAVAATCHAVIY